MSWARLTVAVACAALCAGCIAHEHHHLYHRVEVAADYTYSGAHPIPLAEGGGWCLLEGEHVHPYAPDYDDYAYDGQDYVFDGPIEVPYDGEHFIPEGGFCFLGGLHFHDYLPLGGDSAGFSWNASAGAYTYQATGIGYHPAATVPVGVATSHGGGGAPAPVSTPLSPAGLRGHLGGPPGWQSAPPTWGPPLQQPPPAARRADDAWRGPSTTPSQRLVGPVAPEPAGRIEHAGTPPAGPYNYQPPLRAWTVPNASGYSETRSERPAVGPAETAQPMEHPEHLGGGGFAHGAPGHPSASAPIATPSATAHSTASGAAGHSAPAPAASHPSTGSGKAH
jgi:hypothetical protein